MNATDTTARLADLFSEAQDRMTRGRGTLAELLAMLPDLRAGMAELKSTGMHRHHIGPSKVVLEHVEALHIADVVGAINPTAHLRTLRRIGVLGAEFRADLNAATARQARRILK